jgi:hypothetical protein
MAPYLLLQLAMVTRVDPFQRRAKDAHGATSRLQAASMGGGIDPFRQPAHHWPPCFCQGPTEGIGHRLAMAGWTPRANHGYRLSAPQQGPKTASAPPVQQQRWAFEFLQRLWQSRIPMHQHTRLSPTSAICGCHRVAHGVVPEAFDVTP